MQAKNFQQMARGAAVCGGAWRWGVCSAPRHFAVTLIGTFVAARRRDMTKTKPLWLSLAALLVAACSAGADDDRFFGEEPGDDVVGEGGGAEYEPGPPPDDCPDCVPDPGDDPVAPEPGTPSGSVCYPGLGGAGDACVVLVPWSAAWGSAYQYPDHSSPQYAKPLRFVDLGQADPDLQIADNFKLSEVMQEWKGDYGVFQPHVVEKLQWLRDQTGGALHINSGYRSPAYNASVGGVTYSRHMYGDAADIRSSAASLTEIRSLCEQLDAGYIGMYSTFVHCDWRNYPLDSKFFTPPTSAVPHENDWRATLPEHTATLERQPDGLRWRAPATGFDEDEPLRMWTAYDAADNVIDRAEGESYEPPARARRLHVWVGGHVHVNTAL